MGGNGVHQWLIRQVHLLIGVPRAAGGIDRSVTDFNTLSITLPSPFNLSIPLTKYWDGQPVTYVCRKRPKKGQDPADPEGVYFSIGFEIIDEDMKAELEKRGGAVTKLGGSGSTTPGETHAPEEGAETSDDVD